MHVEGAWCGWTHPDLAHGGGPTAEWKLVLECAAAPMGALLQRLPPSPGVNSGQGLQVESRALAQVPGASQACVANAPRVPTQGAGLQAGVTCGRLAGEPGLMKICTFFSVPLTVCYQHGLPPLNRLPAAFPLCPE